MSSLITTLECSACSRRHPTDRSPGVCDCGAPLLASYDLATAARDRRPQAGRARSSGIWCYSELLPVSAPESRISLGEGGTPLLDAPRLGRDLGLPHLFVKDEGRNPTGSFKDRGLAVAVSRALALGATELALPSAGNAGLSLAAYAARAGVPAHVAVPSDADDAMLGRIAAHGADLIAVDGLLPEAGQRIERLAAENGWFNLATFREPGRVEGKKTMAFELYEQLDGLPDVIVYPTGGGTGLVAMHKAFDELQALGRIASGRPRLVAAQPAGCAPVVHALERDLPEPEPWDEARTAAHGLRVPRSAGGRLMLEAIRCTLGTARAVSEEEIASGARLLATTEGISASLESGAAVAATARLAREGWIGAQETVVIFNTARA